MNSMYGSSLPVVFTFTSGVAVTDGPTVDIEIQIAEWIIDVSEYC